MAALTPDEIAASLELAAPDLRFLFDREAVDGEVQARFIQAGVTSMRQFAALMKDADDVRKVMKTEFGIDDDTFAGRVRVSKVVVAWENAKVRATKLSELAAECEVRRDPKPLQVTDYMTMRDAFERKWWELEPKKLPSRSYVEKILETVEKSDLKAELLSEVLNQQDGEEGVMVARWDASGVIKAVKTSPQVSLPRDPEELRMRITLLGCGWMFAAFQQTHTAFLQGITPQLFAEYLDYLLGDHCFKLGAKDGDGNFIHVPSWSLLLSYELEIRREALRRVYKGAVFARALRDAWQDPVVKERFFTTPLALQGHSRKRHAPEPVSSGVPKQVKKEGGKSGGKGRAKTTNRDGNCAAKTPDGKNVCFAFNREGGKCMAKKCKFAHVCGRCFKDHPMWKCAPARAEGSGTFQ